MAWTTTHATHAQIDSGVPSNPHPWDSSTCAPVRRLRLAWPQPSYSYLISVPLRAVSEQLQLVGKITKHHVPDHQSAANGRRTKHKHSKTFQWLHNSQRSQTAMSALRTTTEGLCSAWMVEALTMNSASSETSRLSRTSYHASSSSTYMQVPAPSQTASSTPATRRALRPNASQRHTSDTRNCKIDRS